MPNCFQLTCKTRGKPINLQQIDAEICQFLCVPCDPNRWVCDWYNTIGFALAMGKTFPQIRAIWEDAAEGAEPSEVEQDFEVLAYLETNFTSDAWYQHR